MTRNGENLLWTLASSRFFIIFIHFQF
jgi:hypothetical protein